MFNEMDNMILPEGFDPELGDANFTEDGELVDVASIPTTEETASNYEGTVTADEQTPTTEPEETVAPQTLKVRFNHEDRELSLDEAAVYAQKGMNFDKVDAKSRQLEQTLSKYEDMAKLFGYENAEAMMTQAEQNYVDSRIKDLVDQGNSEAIARFLVNQEMEKKKVSQPASGIDHPAPGTLSEASKADIREFAATYPGVTQIPDEVFRMHKGGVRLTTAYEIYQKEQALNQREAQMKAAQDELTILKQNQAAAARGPVTGTVGKAAPEKPEVDDPFLIGFNSRSY